MNLRIPFLLALVTAVAASSLAGAYVGGGTFVVKTQFGTVVDNGGVVCQGANGDGVGGGCLPFPTSVPPSADGTLAGGFVQVADDAAGREVAFQVCLDNNGDGVCGGPQPGVDSALPAEGLGQGFCRDQIFFSHNDDGRFFNALGPLPTSLLRGCEENGGFQGYVVLLCQGAHQREGGAAHTHSLTSGSISLARDGSGYGTFCGGGFGGGTVEGGFVNAAAKAYTIV